jgi:YceI-like domain
MRLLVALFAVIGVFGFFPAQGQTQIYEVSKGGIRFHSNAPQELIKASSAYLTGAVDVSSRTFFFKIGIVSFVGFNSPLQKEHFNENYMESDVFPYATFSGKIIEEIDVSKNGEYDIRAKGKMTIHGVEQQRLIKCHVICKDGVILVQSDFTVLLADHNIKIPRIVSDKLSPEINVSVNATLERKI